MSEAFGTRQDMERGAVVPNGREPDELYLEAEPQEFEAAIKMYVEEMKL